MEKKYLLGIFVVILAGILSFYFFDNNVSGFTTLNNFDKEITIYKSGSCGCCDVYSNYFKGKGNSNVKIVNLEDMSSVKANYKIPSQLESCHTTLVGDYFVEGHIPLEAVEKLLNERPDIKGIAMPGMPSGSPGMPGTKRGDFIIYSVNNDGSYEEFMRI